MNFNWKTLKIGAGILLMLNFSACGVEADRDEYTEWDANEDELVERDEFTSTMNNRYGEWDINRDNYLDENEFSAIGSDYNDNYSDWDANGDSMLDENEFSDGLFSEWDADANGYLDENEYGENYNTLFGD